MDNKTKPRVICHMMSSVDGRILSANWGNRGSLRHLIAHYEKCHETYGSQAWMVGRVTMEKDFTKGEQPVLAAPEKPIAREAFVGNLNATSFAIAVDAHGKLGWKENNIGGDHLIEVLTEQVSDSYLAYLRTKGISYIFGGKTEIDFAFVLKQLAELFRIQTLMLEGGGHLNGSLLNEGLIDELSLLILPIADGTPGTPTTFEVTDYLNKKPAALMRLLAIERLDHDVIWLRYRLTGQ